MADKTAIEWADSTFNPWIGCTRVSSACDFCYAERWGERFGVQWGNHPRRRTSAATWRAPLTWDRRAKAAGTKCLISAVQIYRSRALGKGEVVSSILTGSTTVSASFPAINSLTE